MVPSRQRSRNSPGPRSTRTSTRYGAPAGIPSRSTPPRPTRNARQRWPPWTASSCRAAQTSTPRSTERIRTRRWRSRRTRRPRAGGLDHSPGARRPDLRGVPRLPGDQRLLRREAGPAPRGPRQPYHHSRVTPAAPGPRLPAGGHPRRNPAHGPHRGELDHHQAVRPDDLAPGLVASAVAPHEGGSWSRAGGGRPQGLAGGGPVPPGAPGVHRPRVDRLWRAFVDAARVSSGRRRRS